MAKKTIVQDTSSVETTFEEGTYFHGVLEFEKPLLINGFFEGEIRSKGILIIGNKGKIKANIKAGTVIVGGEVRNVEYGKNHWKYSNSKIIHCRRCNIRWKLRNVESRRNQ